MNLITARDAQHKAWLLRLLTEIADSKILSRVLGFKGGTMAAMLGYLDRFSVDLDFDLLAGSEQNEVRQELMRIFEVLKFKLNHESKTALQFTVKYRSPAGERNTIKIDALENKVKANKYTEEFLPEIDRVMICQTKETMFANKMVAVIDRWEKHRSIAGRDIYDIHHFFMNGFGYLPEVVVERTGLKPGDYLKKLAEFIQDKVTETVLVEDLNTLLPVEKFREVRKYLKIETVRFLEEERERLLRGEI